MPRRSSYGELIGPVFEKYEDGEKVLGIRVSEKHINMGGIAHGGMLASFADMSLGQFESRDMNQLTVTVRMVVDFISVGRLGDWIEGRSIVTRETKTMVFAEASVTQGAHLIVKASAVFKVLKKRR
jgi:uncharacterized protein (TIGR00369 family)